MEIYLPLFKMLSGKRGWLHYSHPNIMRSTFNPIIILQNNRNICHISCLRLWDRDVSANYEVHHGCCSAICHFQHLQCKSFKIAAVHIKDIRMIIGSKIEMDLLGCYLRLIGISEGLPIMRAIITSPGDRMFNNRCLWDRKALLMLRSFNYRW